MLTATDWENRYLTGDMPWEKGAASPGLEDFLRRHPGLPRGSVLVPGCGTGHDVLVWARCDFRATGMDHAPSAIRLAADRAAASGIPASFIEGDFLRDPPPDAFDWLFEHTLFCAIHPSERDLYVRAAARAVRPGGSFVALHYMIRDVDGPPYGVQQQELIERFSPHFELLSGWVPPSYPNRVGLELLLWWRRRSTPPGQASL